MKRKLISLILAILVAMPCAFSLVACKDDETPPPPAHSCTFSSEWTSDGEHHWHKCTDQTCTEISDKSAHVWGSEVLADNGIATSECTVCSKTKSEDKTELYKATFENIANKMLGTTASPSALANVISAFTTTDDLYIEAPQAYYTNVKGVAVYVKLLAELIQNDNFKITTAPVKFTYSYSGAFNETGTAVIAYKIDEQNNKVEMTWQVASDQPSGHLDIFLHIDVDYDFSQTQVSSYKFYMENQMMMGSNSMSMFISYLYENNVLKMLNENVDTTAVKDISNGIKDAFVAKANEIIDLQADFTAEYTTAMNIMNPPSHQ